MGKKLDKAVAKDNEVKSSYKRMHKQDEKFKTALGTIKDVTDDMRIAITGMLNNPAQTANKRSLITRMNKLSDSTEREYEELKQDKVYKKAKKFYKKKSKEHDKAVKKHNKKVKRKLADQVAKSNKELKENKKGKKDNGETQRLETNKTQ